MVARFERYIGLFRLGNPSRAIPLTQLQEDADDVGLIVGTQREVGNGFAFHVLRLHRPAGTASFRRRTPLYRQFIGQICHVYTKFLCEAVNKEFKDGTALGIGFFGRDRDEAALPRFRLEDDNSSAKAGNSSPLVRDEARCLSRRGAAAPYASPSSGAGPL